MYLLEVISITTTICLMTIVVDSAPTNEITTQTPRETITTVLPQTSESSSTPSPTTISPSSTTSPSPPVNQIVEASSSSLTTTESITTTTQTTTTSTIPQPVPMITGTMESDVPLTTTSQTSSFTATDALKDTIKPTSPMSSSNESLLDNSNFTCFGKSLGYYADIQEECKVYHFCLLGEYSGKSVYQRISYKCLNNTFFDQQALDCVELSKLSAPCSESYLFYETSNVVLRQAVVGLKTASPPNNTTIPFVGTSQPTVD